MSASWADDLEGQALKLGPAVIRGGNAGIHEGLAELVPVSGVLGFTLPTLVGDGDVMFGLPGRGDPQIERPPWAAPSRIRR